MNYFLRINEPVVISFLSILTFGLFGIMNPSFVDVKSNAFSFIFFISPLACLSFYFYFNKPSFNLVNKSVFTVTIKKFHILIFFSLFILSFSVVYILNQSLTGDELFYITYSFIHSLQILDILNSLNKFIFEEDASLILRIISLLILLNLILLIYLLESLHRYNYKFFCIFSILVLFFIRLVLSFLGGNQVAHAPLVSFYAMFFSSIFGLSDNVVQTGQFIVFLGLSYFVYSNLNLINSSRASRFFITLALFTIPSFFFLGVVLEPVIWSIVCNSIVLCLLSKRDFKEYRILILFVVTMSFFRISSVFALFPIFIHFLFHQKQFVGTLDKVKNLFNVFAPLIIFIPFFIFANIISTAATNDSSISLSKIINVLTDGTMWNFYADVISPYFFIIYFFLILIFFRHKFVQLNFYYLIFLTIAFFSLNENVWPFAKYKLELFIPLLISLVFFVSNNIKTNMNLRILVFASLLISIVNINNIVGFPKSCSKTPGKIESQRLSYQLDFGCNYLTRVPYNLSNAFDYLESKNALSKSYVPGVYNGTFAFVLNGISVKDLISANKIWDKQQELNKDSLWWGFDANPYEINNDIMIDYVLLGYTANSIELKEKLVSYGWEEVYRDSNKYDLSTIILKRPTYK